MPANARFDYYTVRQKCIDEFTRLQFDAYNRDPKIVYRRGMLLLKGELAARGLAMVDGVHELFRLLPKEFEIELRDILNQVLVVKASAELLEKTLNQHGTYTNLNRQERAKVIQSQVDVYSRDVEILQTRNATLRFKLKSKKYDNHVHIVMKIIGYSLLTLMAIGLIIGGVATCGLAMGTSLIPIEAYYGGLVCILAGAVSMLVTGEQAILNYRFFSEQQFKSINDYTHLVDSLPSNFMKPKSKRSSGGINSMFYNANPLEGDRFEEVDEKGNPVLIEKSCLYN